MPITPRQMEAFDGEVPEMIREVAVFGMDIDGHYEPRAFLYVVPRISGSDMILGMQWLRLQDVRIHSSRSELFISSSGTLVRNRVSEVPTPKSEKMDCI